MRFVLLLFVFSVSVLLIPPATAGPASRETLQSLTATADGIVIGSVNAIMGNGTASASIQVERVLKGPIVQGRTILLSFSLPRGPLANGKVSTVAGHGLLFLRNNVGGIWSILPATLGDVDWEDTYVSTPSDDQAKLRSVASASLPARPSVLDMVLLEIVIATEAGANVPFDLVDSFRQTRSPVLAAAFTRFLESQHPRLLIVGLRGSLAQSDPSSILAIHQKYASLASSTGWVALLQEIRFYYLNSSPQSIEALGEIVIDGKTSVDLRVAAATALAKIHTPQALPYLATLLKDQNVTLRAMAVGGLSSFANNVPIGSHEPAPGTWSYRTADTISHSAFDATTVGQQESYYVGFWQTWWQQNRTGLSH